MPRYEGKRGVSQFAVDDVEIRAADRTRGHPEEDFAWSGFGNRAVLTAERLGRTMENHCAHAVHRSGLRPPIPDP